MAPARDGSACTKVAMEFARSAINVKDVKIFVTSRFWFLLRVVTTAYKANVAAGARIEVA